MMNMRSSESLVARTTIPPAKQDYSRNSTSWKLRCLFGDCMRAAKKTARKCLSFLVPSSTTSAKDSARSSSSASSIYSSNMQWCRANADISIYDAILHCKKSIGRI
ncbi:uncharacterized protein LOC122054169 [Zingiber officinale]|uniref:uncharacterized protein LOC122054169 n=1 Tax=Zingiber officinale TaxID=94328 RepID=UPI001C4CB740|nr:uncharacterized protein LOC122054169 [Zingiber officinale]